MNKVLQFVGKLNPLWLCIWAVMFILSATIGIVFGIVGLAEMQKQNPHALDKSFISYGFLYFLATLEPIMVIGTIVLVVLLYAFWPIEKPNSREVKE